MVVPKCALCKNKREKGDMCWDCINDKRKTKKKNSCMGKCGFTLLDWYVSCGECAVREAKGGLCE